MNARAQTIRSSGTLLLTREQVSELLRVDECIDVVEEAFRAHAAGRSIPPGVLGAHVEGGGFHIKTAGLTPVARGTANSGGASYFAAKLNGNFHSNAERFGLPRIQGLVVLADATHGYPLAVMDSSELTAIRTAAATGVAARYLAPETADTVTLVGCGLQAPLQLAALRCVRPIRTVYAVDTDRAAAERLVAGLASSELMASVVDDLGWATRRSQMVVTSTPAREPVLHLADVFPGTFIAAIGADSEDKQELDPGLLAEATLVVDHLEQCATIGDLHHAIEAGVLSREDAHAELQDVVAGRRPGRTRAEEITIFDSTGVALEDVAAAALVFERARDLGLGQRVSLL